VQSDAALDGGCDVLAEGGQGTKLAMDLRATEKPTADSLEFPGTDHSGNDLVDQLP
jgi:hypothetical protein